MARIKFDKLTLSELHEAQAEIAALIEAKKEAERESLKAKLIALAGEGGFTVDELFNGKSRKSVVLVRPTKKVAPKYRNPQNGHELWSGRGRQPLWFVAALKKGVKPEKLLIK